MKYNISDIVKAAKQVADLENSDFISWNENIRLLNEAWTAVHQKLINKGDFTFVNEMNITKPQSSKQCATGIKTDRQTNGTE